MGKIPGHLGRISQPILWRRLLDAVEPDNPAASFRPVRISRAQMAAHYTNTIRQQYGTGYTIARSWHTIMPSSYLAAASRLLFGTRV